MDADNTTSESTILLIACSEGILSSEQVDQVTREAQSRETSPLDVAYEQGLLSPKQVEQLQPLTNRKSVIPDYEFLGLLGAGGMGSVYKARQLKLDRIVAVKLMKLTDPSSAQRSQLEARATARLQHPNIVTAYDYGMHQGRVYLVMELIRGESLQERVNRDGPFDEQTALLLLRQAAGALRFAAQHTVTHRDIKPANLLLTENPDDVGSEQDVPLIKIADFGLARFNSDPDDTRLTMDGSTLGTPAYAAPEQLENSRVDHRADIYSLGATFYYMLTGTPPYAGKSVMHVISSKLNGDEAWDKTLPEHVRPACIALFQRMIAFNPEERFASYDDLITTIEMLGGVFSPRLTTLPPTQAPQSLLNLPVKSQLQDKAERSRRPLLTAVLLLVAAGVGLAGYSLLDNPLKSVNLQKLIPSGEVGPTLFDGMSVPIKGAKSGEWEIAQEDLGEGLKGANVLAGKNGTRLFAIPPEIPLFELQFNVFPLDQVPVDVLLGSETDPRRTVIRMQNQQIEAGIMEKPGTELIFLDEKITVPFLVDGDPPVYQRVSATRQSDGWIIYVNGVLMGGFPAPEVTSTQVLELNVPEGTAHFSDFRITPLKPVEELAQ